MGFLQVTQPIRPGRAFIVSSSRQCSDRRGPAAAMWLHIRHVTPNCPDWSCLPHQASSLMVTA